MLRVLILEPKDVVGDWKMSPAAHVTQEQQRNADIIIGTDVEGDAQFIKHPSEEDTSKILSRSWSIFVQSMLQAGRPAVIPKVAVLSDMDPMPFGKHKGTLMHSVPDSYYCWLWGEGMKDDVANSNVAAYISKNLAGLKDSHPDGVWD